MSVDLTCAHCEPTNHGGCVPTSSEQAERTSLGSATLITDVVLAIFILASFIYVLKMGNSSIESLHSQTDLAVGLKSSYRTEMGPSRLSLCVPNGLLRLGKIRHSRWKYAAVAKSYKKYFVGGGQGVEVAHHS